MALPLTVSCFSKIQIGFTFPVLAHPGSPGKRAAKCVRVCKVSHGAESEAWDGEPGWEWDSEESHDYCHLWANATPAISTVDQRRRLLEISMGVISHPAFSLLCLLFRFSLPFLLPLSLFLLFPFTFPSSQVPLPIPPFLSPLYLPFILPSPVPSEFRSSINPAKGLGKICSSDACGATIMSRHNLSSIYGAIKRVCVCVCVRVYIFCLFYLFSSTT